MGLQGLSFQIQVHRLQPYPPHDHQTLHHKKKLTNWVSFRTFFRYIVLSLLQPCSIQITNVARIKRCDI
jgi:hypothetical protein